jgi:hypothetical protein
VDEKSEMAGRVSRSNPGDGRPGRWRQALTAVAVVSCMALLGAGMAAAEGTEVLGPPQVTVAAGTDVAVEGVGLGGVTTSNGGTGQPNQPGTFALSIPEGATVKQVLLYWEGHGYYADANDPGPDDTVTLNGVAVAGTLIGGPTKFFGPVHGAAFRSDVTGLDAVRPGANSLTVAGMNNSFANNGAGVVVIYDAPGGTPASISLRDGLDLAFRDFAPTLDTTAPQTFEFDAEPAARTAQLGVLTGSVGLERPNAIRISTGGVTTTLTNPLFSEQGPEWDAKTIPVAIPAGATSVTVQLLSEGDGTSNPPASLSWVMGSLSVPTTPPLPPPPPPKIRPTFLIIDEDGIDNGPRYWTGTATSFTSSTIKTWTANDVNDDRPGLAQRLQLRWFGANVGKTYSLWTGQVGDEGWFAPKEIPASWASAGPTTDGLRNLLGNPSQPAPHNVGPGLGTGSNPERLLDKIPHVIPLRAEGLWGLRGKTVCALVWDSDVSINYDGPPLGINGSLKGEKLGVVAFDVHDAVHLSGFSSSTLPRVQVTVRDANKVCEGPLSLYADAPEPKSSSVPMDVRPNFGGDDSGYAFVTR